MVSVAFLGSWSSHGLSSPLPTAPPAGAAARLRAAYAAATASSPEAGASGPFSSALCRLGVLGLACVSAASWRSRASSGDRRSGRVVVFGRNYETNIKHKKGPAELKKAKITAKHLRQIILLCKESGPDPDLNPRLDRQIRAALKENVPRDTINRRIKAFSESKDSIMDMEITGVGCQGLAVLVNAVTDNSIRTRTDVREAFKQVGGDTGEDGSLSHIFKKEGVFIFDDIEEDKIMEASMEAEVEDVEQDETGAWRCVTLPENYHSTLEAFDNQGLEPDSSGVECRPEMPVELSEEGTYECKRLLHFLGEIEEVGEVYHNGIFKEGVELNVNNYGIPMRYKPRK